MGNSESYHENVQIEFNISTHRPLSSGIWVPINNRRCRKSAYLESSSICSSNAILDSPPQFQHLFFTCKACKSICFDGGLSKIVKCECKTYKKRINQDNYETINSINMQNFEKNFIIQNTFPPTSYIPELVTLILGVFRDDVDNSYILDEKLEFFMVFDQILSAFFKDGLRCLGLGDYFKCGGMRFKVLGAFPTYGIVTERTVVSCSDLLSQESVIRMHILPLSPNRFNEDDFANIIQPYFKSTTRHIKEDSCFYLDSKPYVITNCQPSDGIVTSETRIYFNGDPLEPMHYASLAPFVEDLTYHYHLLTREKLIEEVISRYIMLHFQGFKRLVSLNQIIIIEGVGFKVIDCWPPRGVVIDTTRIIYDGSMCRRGAHEYYNPNTLLIRRGYLMEDPLLILSQQMAQLQIMMDSNEGEIIGTSTEIIESLPVRLIKNIDEDTDLGKCMICLCPYAIEDEAKTLSCCNFYLVHMFHSTCIDEWLRRSTYCPLCKNLIQA